MSRQHRTKTSDIATGTELTYGPHIVVHPETGYAFVVAEEGVPKFLAAPGYRVYRITGLEAINQSDSPVQTTPEPTAGE